MRGASDEGQAATELALVLPLVVLLLLAVVQVTLVARDQLLVVQAARAAGREAAVDPRPASVLAAARGVGGLKSEGMATDLSQGKGTSGIISVRVRYRSATDVALIGPLLPDVLLQAKAAIRVESGHVGQRKPDAARKAAGTAS